MKFVFTYVLLVSNFVVCVNMLAGLLDLNSSSANGRDKESSGSGNSSSFTNNDKNFRGAISHIQQQEESWLSADVAMVIVLSEY